MNDDEGEEGYHTAKEQSSNTWLIVDSEDGQEFKTERQKIQELEALVDVQYETIQVLNETIKVLSDHNGKIPTEVLLMTSQHAKHELIKLLTMSTQLTEDDEERKELLLQRKDIQFTFEEVEQYKEQALQHLYKEDCDDGVLANFSAWQTIFDKHPINVEKQKAESQARENREASKRKKALLRMRSIMPRDIDKLTNEQLKSMNIPELAIKRLKKKTLRWLYLLWMSSATIAKLHIGDMMHKYAYSKGDIQELRAVVECLPTDDEMESDPDGKKKEWADTFRKKLDDLVRKEENGKLSETEARDNAWKEVDEEGLQFEDPYEDELSITPMKSSAFDGNHKQKDVNADNDTTSSNVRKLSQLFNK